MHHFLPHIPWYKYFKVWSLANGIFRKQNIPDKAIFSIPDKHFKDRVINEKKLNNDTTLLVELESIPVDAEDRQEDRNLIAAAGAGVADTVRVHAASRLHDLAYP